MLGWLFDDMVCCASCVLFRKVINYSEAKNLREHRDYVAMRRFHQRQCALSHWVSARTGAGKRAPVRNADSPVFPELSRTLEQLLSNS